MDVEGELTMSMVKPRLNSCACICCVGVTTTSALAFSWTTKLSFAAESKIAVSRSPLSWMVKVATRRPVALVATPIRWVLSVLRLSWERLRSRWHPLASSFPVCTLEATGRSPDESGIQRKSATSVGAPSRVV